MIRPLPTCVDADHLPTFDEMLSGSAVLPRQSRVAVEGAVGQGVDALIVRVSIILGIRSRNS